MQLLPRNLIFYELFRMSQFSVRETDGRIMDERTYDRRTLTSDVDVVSSEYTIDVGSVMASLTSYLDLY